MLRCEVATTGTTASDRLMNFEDFPNNIRNAVMAGDVDKVKHLKEAR